MAPTPLDYLFQHQGSGRVVQAGVLPGADEPIKPGGAGRQDLRQYVLQHLKVRHSTGQGICILHGQPGPVAITNLYFALTPFQGLFLRGGLETYTLSPQNINRFKSHGKNMDTPRF